jgi:predicted dehydrogenase
VELDALLVETPATHHAEFWVKTLAANPHVMGDVPCVESFEQGLALWEAQRGSKASYSIGANPNVLATFINKVPTSGHR